LNPLKQLLLSID